MEIKIGIQNVARELTLESRHNADDIEKMVRKALAEDEVLILDDENGRRVMIAASKLAYIELGQENARKVGFGAV